DTMWRPWWTKARRDSAFDACFAAEIPTVEAAASTIASEVGQLLDSKDCLTLIHNDINPSNVFVLNGRPYYVDWQSASYGPWYLDLPHHHCNLTQAEHYRQALEERGVSIPSEQFAESYRIAARYVGLRYMWWTLEYW